MYVITRLVHCPSILCRAHYPLLLPQRSLSPLNPLLSFRNPPSPFTSPHSSMSFNLDSEVRLSSTNADRERLDELATLYGLIVSLDYLERAYVRDSITSTQYVSPHPLPKSSRMTDGDVLYRYAPACSRLLTQYKSVMKLVGDSVVSLEAFMQEYRVRPPNASKHDRLELIRRRGFRWIVRQLYID